LKIRVYYEDVDAGGVVYHANYLKFCERVRSEAFFTRGLKPYDEDGHFVVKDLQAEYSASAYLGDLLEIETKLVEIGAASFCVHQEIYKDGARLFWMEITLVHVGLDGKIKRLGAKKQALLREMFG